MKAKLNKRTDLMEQTMEVYNDCGPCAEPCGRCTGCVATMQQADTQAWMLNIARQSRVESGG